MGVGFHRENIMWRWKFLGINFPEKILHWEDLTEFLYEIVSISYFLYADSMLHVYMFWRNVRGNFQHVWDCLRNFSVKGDFPRDGFSLGEFSAGKILHGGIYHGRKFPLRGGGGVSGKHFSHKGAFLE